MAHKKNNTDLTELLLKCAAQPNTMLSMLEWLCRSLGGSAAGAWENEAVTASQFDQLSLPI